jgi:hypothetical protein
MYGCKNRGEFAPSMPAQDGWYMDGYTRTPRMVAIPFRMSKPCNYTTTALGQADPQCLDCKRRKTDDADRSPDKPAVADGTALHGGIQGPLLAESAGDSTRPGVLGPAKAADGGNAEALEQFESKWGSIYRPTEE